MFNNQPTFDDNPTARNRVDPSNHQGDWWIGGFENRSSKEAEAGAIQGDGPRGTLTSPRFRIIGRKISFLIGGGCNMTVVRAELLVDNEVRSISIVSIRLSLEEIIESIGCGYRACNWINSRIHCFWCFRLSERRLETARRR